MQNAMQSRRVQVSSLYGLFTLLQVVDIGPDGEAGWARAAGETKKAWAAWGLGLGLGGSADPAAGIQRLAASLSLAVSSVFLFDRVFTFWASNAPRYRGARQARG